jgi:sec-independent protein translocase protein TatA
MIPAFIAVPGGLEMAVILLIAILLFGANKLPGLARSIGQATGEFKKGRQEIERELRDAAAPIEDDVDVDASASADREEEVATA